MFSEKIKRATVKKTKSNNYFVSLTLEAQEDAKELQNVHEKAISAFDMSARNFLVNDIVKLENPRFYSQYPELVCELAEKIFTNDGKARKKFWKMFRESQEGKISLLQILRDLFRIKRAI